ncbi:beta-glucosidase-like glycosyl hydrolase [Terriglobus roseus DSM 18391]|uniref:Beta-glucosidase-like glycosyl hydrolase n=1 Tax=Terriglobus roseus (strain DSM 18391 / NRRL B-41598 / KBS 63) TaxID=926566 RepID=I3ZDU8_TERRK|nr:glycoside hydrolase family 3 C-terminal domain-containing protein [Terriglobus roseus]AFL87416.1 beta-glucosidase-like glycosyl hydrolase [Terriglobus roseus DSM 18391]
MHLRSVALSTAAVLLSVASCVSASAQGSNAPASGGEVYRDMSRPIEDRITDLIKRFTLQEKAMQLNHTNRGVPRLGLPMWGGWNQTLHGVWSKQPTTLFPIPTAMGATWDPELVHTVADAMSDEARALYNAHAEGPRTPHGLVYRSPVINISRDPRWGRIQEVFSEDPLLTGRMGVAYVRGLQGDDLQHLKLAATVKHFAVNNVESGRQHLNADVDERNLFEFWLPHWRAAIMEAHAQSVMSSYNAINGMPDAVNHWLLTDVLRKKWGFDGFVTDDLGAVALLSGTRATNTSEPGQHFSEDPVVAAAAAIRAGNDSDDVEFETNLPLAVQRGLLTEKDVDGALRNVLRVGFRLGAYDPPQASKYSRIGMDVVRSQAHRDLSQRVAEESMTLLLNRRQFLPLQRDQVKSVAVIGPAGGEAYETGNYYGTPAVKTSVTEGLRALLGSGVKVEYEKGAGYVDLADDKEIERAANLARKSDVVVLCLGTNLQVEAEGRDRRDLNLPGAQQRLLEAVYAANPKVALVLMNAGPLGVTWAHDHVPAILSAWYPGELGGAAIARTLFGLNNPGGHLPYTVYANLDGVPPQNEYDVSRGYTYQYFKGVPLYPFGHGLSYTHFDYSKLKVTQTSGDHANVTVSFTLTNTGQSAGAEVTQLYSHQVKSSEVQPLRTLRGFERVTLQPGESKAVAISIPTSALGWYDTAVHNFRVEPGAFNFMVGSSSEDIRLRDTVTIAPEASRQKTATRRP